MSRHINQPLNQIKLTNVSLVRLKKGKKRFEIACYKNKVLEWRSGIETDLDNVLQIPNVFLNVSKGQTAPAAELTKAFGKDATPDTVILEILRKGEMQVGEKERAAQLERVQHEVVDIVAGKLVDPRTRRVYTTGMIEKALDMLSAQAHQQQQERQDKEKEKQAQAQAQAPEESGDGTAADKDSKTPLWTGVTTAKSAKSQALDAMKALVALQPIPVMRARMRLRVSCPTGVLKQAVKGPAPGAGGAAAAAAKSGGGGHGGKHGGKKGAAAAAAAAAAASEAAASAAAVAAAGTDGDEAGQHTKTPGTVKDRILSYVEQVESQDVIGSAWEVVGFVEPGAFKALSDFVGNETRGQGRVEMLEVAVTQDD